MTQGAGSGTLSHDSSRQLGHTQGRTGSAVASSVHRKFLSLQPGFKISHVAVSHRRDGRREPGDAPGWRSSWCVI